MRPEADLDALLEARLAALARRVHDVSFATDEPADAAVDELWQLIDLARRDGEPLGFAVDPTSEAGSRAGAPSEVMRRMRQILERLSHPIIVETREAHVHIKTTVGWTGNTMTYIAPGPALARNSPSLATHEAALKASLVTNLRGLRLLTLFLVATGKIAAMIAIPGAALRALPIAYKCVRDIYHQWNASNADTGDTPWL